VARQLHTEIEQLKKKIFELCALVEENFKNAVKAILDRDLQRAEKVLAQDDAIDTMEIEVEEECLKVLALHQPVAVDLRFIIGAMKINNDLERIGDLAVNVAERGFEIIKSAPVDIDTHFNEMLARSVAMIRKSLSAFLNFDTKLSYEVCKLDDEVDALHRKMFSIFKAEVAKNPSTMEVMLQYLTISRHIERIADHATNIAEDVIYMVDGDIIRHNRLRKMQE